MKIGDKVKMSERNPNHLENGVDAYAGMEGIVTDIYDDGAFSLNCGNSILVVPMNNAFKQQKKGVWIWLNGKHIFHKRIDTKPERSPKKMVSMVYTTKFNEMKKLIDIPDEIVKDLKKLAIDENKDLKNFIQDHLILLVRGEKKEQKTSTNVKSKRSGSNGA